MQRRNFFSVLAAGAVAGVSVPKIFGAETDEPTYIKQDGTKVWLDEHGEYHRVGGPAVIKADGHQAWYKHGQPHRLDGPAIIFCGGRQDWYKDGRLHRIGGPAISGSYFAYWYENGKCVPGPGVSNE